jgi:CBS domain-containing protein
MGMQHQMPPAPLVPQPPPPQLQQAFLSPSAASSAAAAGVADAAAAQSQHHHPPAPTDEPAASRAAVARHLASHTAAELVPESGKVVVLSADLPVRLAFHALHEHGVATAPVWCPRSRELVGMLSASDLIHALRDLRDAARAGGSPLSEAQMDAHTIRALRAGAAAAVAAAAAAASACAAADASSNRSPPEGIGGGRPNDAAAPPAPPRPLVSVAPDDSLAAVAATLASAGVSVAPIVAPPVAVDLAAATAAAAEGPVNDGSRPPSPCLSSEDVSRMLVSAPVTPPPDPRRMQTSVSASAASGGGAYGPTLLAHATLAGLLSSALRALRAVGGGGGAGSQAATPTAGAAGGGGILGAGAFSAPSVGPGAPLLRAQLCDLPLGTWAPDAPPCRQPPPQQPADGQRQLLERRDVRRVRPIVSVTPATPLTSALGLLLEHGVSSLPVVDAETGALVDVYARADIGALARGGAYSRLQWEDVTVGQALALALLPPATASASGHYGENPASQQRSSVPSPRPPRVYVCTAADSFRAVVERLACSSNNCSSSSSSPGVRRVFVVDPATRRVQAVVSLSDVAAYLFPGVAEAAAASKAGGRNA